MRTLAIILALALPASASYLQPPIPFGQLSSAADFSATANTPTAITYDTQIALSNITHTIGQSAVTLPVPGTYMISVSAVYTNTSEGPFAVAIWLRKNGVDVANSNTRLLTPEPDGVATTLAVTLIESFTAGQYFELIYEAANAAVKLDGYAAVPTPTPLAGPASPSIIVTVTRVSR